MSSLSSLCTSCSLSNKAVFKQQTPRNIALSYLACVTEVATISAFESPFSMVVMGTFIRYQMHTHNLTDPVFQIYFLSVLHLQLFVSFFPIQNDNPSKMNSVMHRLLEVTVRKWVSDLLTGLNTHLRMITQLHKWN
ncbi:unnamed protein product [Dicrocoelium dendriticum]|nr:unnamed protein product [Dicrocoelium dendriticum]